MNYSAFLLASTGCPSCGRSSEQLLAFKWGNLPYLNPHPDEVYRPGDAVRWRLERPNARPRSVAFTGEGPNYGDPALKHVRVLAAPTGFTDKCPSCNSPNPVVFLDIEDGVITDLRSVPEGWTPEGKTEWEVAANGSLTPIPELVGIDTVEPGFFRLLWAASAKDSVQSRVDELASALEPQQSFDLLIRSFDDWDGSGPTKPLVASVLREFPRGPYRPSCLWSWSVLARLTPPVDTGIETVAHVVLTRFGDAFRDRFLGSSAFLDIAQISDPRIVEAGFTTGRYIDIIARGEALLATLS